MATIDILETFQVKAPADVVWRFLIDPNAVAGCLPGAQLEDVIDERTFNGSMKVKVGPITTSYKGKVVMTNVDEASRTVEMSAEGREGSGGSVRGGMTSHLTELDDGVTEVRVESKAEITGRIAQFGRGLIQEVSHQLFQQFVACAGQRLEAQAALEAGASPAPAASTPTDSATASFEPPAEPPEAVDAPSAPETTPAAENSADAAPTASAPVATAHAAPPSAATPTAAAPTAAATPAAPTATETAAGLPPSVAVPGAAPTIAPPPAKPVSILPVLLRSIGAMVVRVVTAPFRKKAS